MDRAPSGPLLGIGRGCPVDVSDKLQTPSRQTASKARVGAAFGVYLAYAAAGGAHDPERAAVLRDDRGPRHAADDRDGVPDPQQVVDALDRAGLPLLAQRQEVGARRPKR